MSIPQVGQGAVAVVPTFRGFRKKTDAEFATSAKAGASIFNRGFSSAGTTAGKGFASSFTSATKGISSASLRDAQSEVAKASREVAALRIRELDATGKVRVAEAALGEARRKYSSDSSQVIRAEERLASVQRSSLTAKSSLLGATQRLTAAQRDLASATTDAAAAGGRSGGVFSRLSTTFSSAGRDGGSRFSQGFRDVLGGVLGANILTGIGYTIGRTIGQGARAGIGYTLESITLASDLEQSTGAVTAQFKDQADVIFDAAKAGARAVGLGRSTYQQYATIVGAQLKNLGLRQEDVSGTTVDLIELGADLAAQFGGPTSKAVAALSSLLRGERDPIEAYGVGLKQVDIDARLAAMGMSDLTGEAEKQATIQATLALLWEQTADAQGTFLRERDTTYAGRLSVLNAELANAQEDFGNALLPTATSVLQFANDDLLPILQSTLAQAGPQISQSLKDAMPEIEATLRALGENLPELIDLGGQIGSAISGSISGDFGEGGIIGGIPTVQKELEGFLGWLQRDFDTYDGWDDYWSTFGTGFEHWWDVARDGIDDAAREHAAALPGMYAAGFQTADAMDRATSAGTTTGLVISQAAADAIRSDKGSLIQAGRDVGDGIALGMESKVGKVDLAGAALGYAAQVGFKRALKIASPSKVGVADGKNYAQSLAQGMLGETSSLNSASERLAAAARVSLLPANSQQASSASSGDSRPIYADGIGLIGFIRTLANGEARLVWSDMDSDMQLRTRMG